MEKGGKGWRRGGPAECAVARKPPARMLRKGLQFRTISPTRLIPQGAGRIEPAERYTASPRIGISAAEGGRI